MDVDELLALERPLTQEECEFIEQELLKTAKEFQKLAAELTEEIAREDPEMAEQLQRSARAMVLNIEEAAAIPWPEKPEATA